MIRFFRETGCEIRSLFYFACIKTIRVLQNESPKHWHLAARSAST
jgi:hypothetical protein